MSYGYCHTCLELRPVYTRSGGKDYCKDCMMPVSARRTKATELRNLATEVYRAVEWDNETDALHALGELERMVASLRFTLTARAVKAN